MRKLRARIMDGIESADEERRLAALHALDTVEDRLNELEDICQETFGRGMYAREDAANRWAAYKWRYNVRH